MKYMVYIYIYIVSNRDPKGNKFTSHTDQTKNVLDNIRVYR